MTGVDRHSFGVGVEDGEQQVFDVFRLHARHAGPGVELAAGHHLRRDAEGGLPGAFAGTGLQHEEAVVLDRELEVE